MTYRRKGKRWAVVSRLLGVALLFVFALALSSSANGDSGGIAANQSKSSASVQASDPPVLIESDADFVSQGWPGNGTNENPYVISGLYFDSGPMPYISVSHVTATFVIANCLLLWGSHSTYDPSVKHIIVQDARVFSVVGCMFTGNSRQSLYSSDIVADHSLSCRVAGNVFRGGTVLSCSGTKNVTIMLNTIEGSSYPLLVDEAENVSVIDNIFSPGGSFYLIASNRIDFSMNNVSGSIDPSLDAKEVHIVGNSFSGTSDGLIIPSRLMSSELRTLEIAHNNFTDGGIAVDMLSAYPLSIGTFEENYVMNRPILVVRNQRGVQIDCGACAQVICYNCTDLELFGGHHHDVACGIAFDSCHNCSVLNGEFDSCYHGIWSYASELIRVQSVIATNCDQAIIFEHSYYVQVSACSLNDGSQGLFMYECSFAVINGNTFVRNSRVGVYIVSCWNASVSGNVFEENGRNALDLTESYDTWDGNAWDDYFGIGAYVVTGPPDWYYYDFSTVADHNARSTRPWFMLPVTQLLFGSALFVCLLSIAYLLSRQWKGTLASLLGVRNNHLLILSVFEVLIVPVVFRIYPGTNLEQSNGYWMLRSIGLRTWSQSGLPYGTAGVGTGEGLSYVPVLLIVLLITWNAWRLEKTGASLSLRLINLILLLAFSILVADLAYPSFYPSLGVVDIPLPLSPLLVFITLRYVKRTTSAGTPLPDKTVPQMLVSSDSLPTIRDSCPSGRL